MNNRQHQDAVRIAADRQPVLFVIVDTEEEFDWSAPYSRSNRRNRDAAHRPAADVLSRGIIPTYVVDFPVASQADGFAAQGVRRRGHARIGAHLHPWVNPPFAKSSPGETASGAVWARRWRPKRSRAARPDRRVVRPAAPVVYKAGRYGFGPSTASALEALDFAVDVSINPRMDYTARRRPIVQGFRYHAVLLRPAAATTRDTVLDRLHRGRLVHSRRMLHRVVSHPALEPTASSA